MNPSKLLLPLTLIFIGVTVVIFALYSLWVQYGFDPPVLAGANTLFFLVSMLIFFMQKKAMGNPNPNVFVRSVIAGMMIKMFATVMAVLLYVLGTGNGYNKPSVFLSLFIYLLYLAAEVAAIKRLNKKRNV